MTPKQCRMARAALGWSTQELCTRSGIGRGTVNHFELQHMNTKPLTVAVLRATLEAAGIVFIDGASDMSGVMFRDDNAPTLRVIGPRFKQISPGQIVQGNGYLESSNFHAIGSNEDDALDVLGPTQKTSAMDLLMFVSEVIDWNDIRKLLAHMEQDCVFAHQYSLLTLVKLLFLRDWYSLTMDQLLEMVWDRSSFRRFANISSCRSIPSMDILHHFLQTLEQRGYLQWVFNEVDVQLNAMGISIRRGMLVEAGVVVGGGGGVSDIQIHEWGRTRTA